MTVGPWECPRCKRINAAWLDHCDCKPEQPNQQQVYLRGVAMCQKCGQPNFGEHVCSVPYSVRIVEPISGVTWATECPFCDALVWYGATHNCPRGPKPAVAK